MNKERFLTVISGPSGSGKDSVIQEVIKNHPEVECSVSATTREPREGEMHGVHYFFITKEAFEAHISRDELLEYTNYVGNYYGTLISQIDDRLNRNVPCVLVIEVEGAANVKKEYPHCTTIFIKPPSMEELEKRLRSRGTEQEALVKKRLHRAEEELQYAHEYDHVLVNDELSECAKQVFEIIRQNCQDVK